MRFERSDDGEGENKGEAVGGRGGSESPSSSGAEWLEALGSRENPLSGCRQGARDAEEELLEEEDESEATVEGDNAEEVF